jgi:hypothetical protein
MTSSARASSVGVLEPEGLRGLRFGTSSYLVGACTGRSADFSPPDVVKVARCAPELMGHMRPVGYLFLVADCALRSACSAHAKKLREMLLPHPAPPAPEPRDSSESGGAPLPCSCKSRTRIDELYLNNPYYMRGLRARARGSAGLLYPQCQSASKFDPRSASNFDPLKRRARVVALAPSELVGVAETARARVGM